MLHTPTPILGDITALTIATPDLEKSLAFYQQLGFKEVQRAEWPFPWIQVSDGALLIMLRKDPKPYLALTYYVKNIDRVVKDLEKKKVPFTETPKKGAPIKRYVLTSPDGLNVSLVNITEGFAQPPGPTMLKMPQEDYFNPAKYVNKTAGMYGELAHPVKDLNASIKFWELLGFKAVSKFESPYPWAIITDGLSAVGLHQASHFSQPALTFFAADMADKIAALKKAGLKNITEQSAGNVILPTPEKQQVFLFTLGGGGGAGKNTRKEIEQPIIETERFLLKELNPEILDQLFTTCCDEEIITFMGLKDKDELELERTKWQKGYTTCRITMKMFLIADKATGEIIGRCGFHNWYAEHRRSEIGYHMTDETRKRQGVMTEALKAIIAFGFEQMGLNRIEAMVGPNNTASLALVKKYGFTKEGTLRQHFYKEGEMQDSVCFGLLRSEYEANKKSKKSKK